MSRYKTEIVKKNHQWQIDLADMNKLKKHNYLYRYWLVVINVHSRFAWVKPMKIKSAKNMYKFVSILNEEYSKYGNLAPKIYSNRRRDRICIGEKNGKDCRLFHTHNREMNGSMVECLIRVKTDDKKISYSYG